MEANCNKAKEFKRWLQVEFPTLNIHLPADFEDWVQVAHRIKAIAEKKILEVDCEILSGCNAMIVFAPDDYTSRGMQVELNHCEKEKIPVFWINSINLKSPYTLKQLLLQFFIDIERKQNE